LVSLEIDTFSTIPSDEIDLFRSVLEGNSYLRSLTLSFKSNAVLSFGSSIPSRLELPHLEHLSLTNFPFWLDGFFQLCSMPKLERLSVTRCMWREPVHLDAKQIRVLHMRYMSSPDPIQVVSGLEELEELTVIGRDTDELIDGLGRPENQRQRLHSLNLSRSNIGTGALVRLVKSKLGDKEEGAEETVPISSLVIDECPNVDAAWLPWLRKHVKLVSCVYMTKKQAKMKR
jgi:hypothetical protein